MGIRHLTTYVYENSRFCMESYELCDTDLVLDGDAVLCTLYFNCTPVKNGCFGGDYDKFANSILKFFNALSECNIIPYVILDGGYESRKMETIEARFRKNLKNAQKINPNSHETSNFQPLMLRETFEDVLRKLKIKVVRCDFEGDRETACIAKTLNCPVLSQDSDFFIFDVPYIPLDRAQLNVSCNIRTEPNTQVRSCYKYIKCEMYKAEKFLKFTGLRKDALPLLAAVIGNDFFSGVSLDQLNLHLDPDKRMDTLISWLSGETKESAMKKILNSYNPSVRTSAAANLEIATSGYALRESKYLMYLKGGDEVTRISDCSSYNTFEEMTHTFPFPFIENFRKCLYSSRYMEILTQNKYFNFKPQIELYTLDHCHTPCINIMSAVHKILRGSSDDLVCLVRIGNKVGSQTLPYYELQLPNFVDIQTMSEISRKELILSILEVEETFVESCIHHFPESWHLFVLALKYMINKSVISWQLVYSLVYCTILLSVVDQKIGFYRSVESFNREYYDKISCIQTVPMIDPPLTIRYTLSNINFKDSLLTMSKAITYFQIKKSSSFDRRLMHMMSQFQSIFLHVNCLNQLLNSPFANASISKCYNGTFIYNFTHDMPNELDEYMDQSLGNSPMTLHLFRLMIKKLKS